MNSLVDRYQDKLAGVLSCWDRVVIRGTLPGLCYAAGMTSYLNVQQIRIFDYPRFAEPLRDEVRANAEKLAAKAGIEIEFMRKSRSRKPGVRSDYSFISTATIGWHASSTRSASAISCWTTPSCGSTI